MPARHRAAARALSCFLDAVMLCDTSAAGWPVLYTNDRWCRATGVGSWQRNLCAGACREAACVQQQQR